MQLKLARGGKSRSVAAISLSNDGAAIGTEWSWTNGAAARPLEPGDPSNCAGMVNNALTEMGRDGWLELA
ncbi:hypothetical protein GGR33_005235 [Methylobacterium brachythecii]|uniref:Uncharacterized protein n=1 Tax=Methylobacterium brachythecii TaxID=1176177 RepID=A0A7W6ALK8_9HYPH|nr:hypothetical protein [Methylobacterium brachythecii]GLS47043.1 hypothetical protein GCM10007884_50440 [Methylobacterium brachythecii]